MSGQVRTSGGWNWRRPSPAMSSPAAGPAGPAAPAAPAGPAAPGSPARPDES
jgi:hypothetical protein